MRLSAAELDERIARLERAYGACLICPERCDVDRLAGETGTCGLGEHGRVYKEYVHFGEEPEIVPTHAVYLAGCNFRCAYCSDWDPVSRPTDVAERSPEWLGRRIRARREQGARTVTFVGGSPDVQPLYVLRALKQAPEGVRVVWNSNLWLEESTLELLVGVVDLWIPDVKYGPGDCDRRLSGVASTHARIVRLFSVLRSHGEDVLARHLLLPGHLECCALPVATSLADLWPGLRLNLMTGYRPFALERRADPLGARIESDEAAGAVERILQAAKSRLDIRVDGRPFE